MLVHIHMIFSLIYGSFHISMTQKCSLLSSWEPPYFQCFYFSHLVPCEELVSPFDVQDGCKCSLILTQVCTAPYVGGWTQPLRCIQLWPCPSWQHRMVCVLLDRPGLQTWGHWSVKVLFYNVWCIFSTYTRNCAQVYLRTDLESYLSFRSHCKLSFVYHVPILFGLFKILYRITSPLEK